MGSDLNAMSLDELKAHKKAVQKELKEAEKAIASFKDREKKAALAAAEKAAAELGFSLAELTGGSKGGKSGKSALPPKYRNPENPKQTWSGRGRRPDWIRAALDAGTDLAEFQI